ncbi:hypothetical protein AAUPMC_11476 [Pasteurella multocida subsp. multocida str. Anand1_cattle]|nr:hypothetical protein AAUPMC_11476 [Pasteurella multocida subsp. multocida str. Anand1_cattle]
MKMIKLKLFELSHFAIDYVFICVEEAGKKRKRSIRKGRQRGDDPLCDVAL